MAPRTAIAKAGALAAVAALASSAQAANAFIVAAPNGGGRGAGVVIMPTASVGGGGGGLGIGGLSVGVGNNRRFLREQEQQQEQPKPVESTDVRGNDAATIVIGGGSAPQQTEAEKAATNAVFDNGESDSMANTGRALKDFDLDDLPDAAWRLHGIGGGPIGIGGLGHRGWRFGDDDSDDDKRRKLMSTDDNDDDDDRYDDNDSEDNDNDRDDNDNDDKRRRRRRSLMSVSTVGAYAGRGGAYGYHRYVRAGPGGYYYRSGYRNGYRNAYPYNLVGGPGRVIVGGRKWY
jgi:hypothetical protein